MLISLYFFIDRLYNILMGRPSKLNEDLICELCKWVADDVPFQYCAEGCGIDYTSFQNWMNQGETDIKDGIESIFSELFLRIKKTYAKVVRDSVLKIKSGDRGWTGEAWVRQRRDNAFMDKQEIVSGDEKVIVNLGNIKGRHEKNDNAK